MTAPDDRLRWRCRRGMLELDLLLGAFLDRGYDEMDERGRAVFARLIAYPDPTLFRLLMGFIQAADREVADVVARIRSAQDHTG